MLKNFRLMHLHFFGFLALLYLFYPLAGCLADTRCGRYKIISNSVWFIIWSGVFTCAGATIIHSLLWLPNNFTAHSECDSFTCYWLTFRANIIQFGMDQLHDSPSEDSVLFIHWFVFTSYLGVAINQFAVISIVYVFYRLSHVYRHTKHTLEFIAELIAAPILALVLLGISAWIAKCKCQWFMINTGSKNPYTSL